MLTYYSQYTHPSSQAQLWRQIYWTINVNCPTIKIREKRANFYLTAIWVLCSSPSIVMGYNWFKEHSLVNSVCGIVFMYPVCSTISHPLQFGLFKYQLLQHWFGERIPMNECVELELLHCSCVWIKGRTMLWDLKKYNNNNNKTQSTVCTNLM